MSQSILDSMTEQEIVRVAMRLLGSKTSKKKAQASRSNGKLGGRNKRAKPKYAKKVCSKIK